MPNKAHLTAISRGKLSKPMQFLKDHGLLCEAHRKGRKLDYGCGKGDDADALEMEKFDPYHFPDYRFAPCFYYLITCNYVLNVIPNPTDRRDVLKELKWLGGNPQATVYVSVRNDRRNLNGWTKRDTWQGFIEDSEIEAQGFTKIHETPNYRLFAYGKIPTVKLQSCPEA